MERDFFGVFAATLTTLSWLPQVRRTLLRGTASDFSWIYLALYGAGLGSWVLYGLIESDEIILVSNVVVLASVVVLVVVKLRSQRIRLGHVELLLRPGTDPSKALKSLEQLGSRLAHDLRAVGIADPDALRATGTDEANRRLVQAGLQTGMHSRQAIQSALEGRGTVEGDWGTASFPGPEPGTRTGRPDEAPDTTEDRAD